jgi:hypothetical protein
MVVSNKTEKPKNMAQMHHICTISGRKQPQEPFASTSTPSPSKMERGPGGEARYKCDNCDNRYKLPAKT